LVITGLMAGVVLVLICSIKPKPAFQSIAHYDEGLHGKKSSITTMLWFAGFFATYVAAEILVSTRLALYMRTYFNMSLESSSNYVTYFFIFLLAGRLVFAFKTFSTRLKTQLNTSLIFSIICLLLGLWLHPFFLALVGLAMAPFYPLSIVYISEKTGHQKRRFLTFVMGLQSLCVIGMHMGVGYLTDIYGLSSALGVGIALLIGSLVCLNIHPKITA
jgi:FHS family glucose/mannose:H+ symporter-like MFS transporter